MSAVCGCRSPLVRETANGEVCDRCGMWWDPRYGSVVPGRVRKPERIRTGRNDPCPCRSGKKFKKCCLR